MPALPPAGKVLRVAVQGIKSFENWANILHFLYTGANPSVADVTTVANDVVGFWNTYMKPRATVDTTLESVKVTDLSSAAGSQVEVAAGPIVGTNAEDPIPGSACFLVDYDVSLRYRGGHPRTYIVGGGDGDLDSAGVDWSIWNPSFIAAMATSWSGFTTHISAITVGATNLGDQCAVRYRSAGVPLAVPIVLDLPTFNTESRVCSQRRRLGKFS